MGIFYRDLKEATNYRGILEILSRTAEFQNMKHVFASPPASNWQKYEKTVLEACEKYTFLDYKAWKKVFTDYDSNDDMNIEYLFE